MVGGLGADFPLALLCEIRPFFSDKESFESEICLASVRRVLQDTVISCYLIKNILANTFENGHCSWLMLTRKTSPTVPLPKQSASGSKVRGRWMFGA
jgi:hypothetical protein